jgi:type VI secretion system protein VasD
MKKFGRLSFILAAVAALAACASPPPPPPPPGIVELTIKAADDLNPDVEGRASPVVVRVYQLGSTVKFMSADFFMLFDKEQATLGPDLVAREEIAVSPGEEKKLTLNLKPDTVSIGLAASFRDIEKAEWRAVIDAPPHATTAVAGALGKLGVKLDAGS